MGGEIRDLETRRYGRVARNASNAFVRLSIDHTLTHPYEPEQERHD